MHKNFRNLYHSNTKFGKLLRSSILFNIPESNQLLAEKEDNFTKIKLNLPYNCLTLLFEDCFVYVEKGTKDNGGKYDDEFQYVFLASADYVAPENGATWKEVIKGDRMVLFVLKINKETNIIEHFALHQWEEEEFVPIDIDSMEQNFKDHFLNDIKCNIVGINRLVDILECKNIKAISKKHEVLMRIPGDKKRRKKLFEYKELVIQTNRVKYKGEGQEPQHLWSNRIHLCRGHFKVYTEEAPLFGKCVGKYWIPAHARGNKRQGMIHKEYTIKEQHGRQAQT